jgi:hypothetical protein
MTLANIAGIATELFMHKAFGSPDDRMLLWGPTEHQLQANTKSRDEVELVLYEDIDMRNSNYSRHFCGAPCNV